MTTQLAITTWLAGGDAMVLLADLALKGAFVLLLAHAAAACFRRASAATRFSISCAGLVAVLALPLLSVITPASRQPLWAVSARNGSGNEMALTIDLRPGTAARQLVAPAGTTGGSTRDIPPAAPRDMPQDRTRALRWVPIVWLIGSAVLLLRLLGAQVALLRIRGRALPASAPLANTAAAVAGEIGLKRRFDLVQSSDLMPMTWGTFRPVIVLTKAADEWTPERVRVVLLHEFAHVLRFDCLTQLLAGLACAVHWFNPLAWALFRMMRLDRERACDDLVLNQGCRASQYAAHLVDISMAFRRVPQEVAIAMARPSQIQHRIAAIVDPSRRRKSPAPAGLLAIVAAAFAVASLVAAQRAPLEDARRIHENQVAALKRFAVRKHAQARALSAATNGVVLPEYETFFTAAEHGDGMTVTNMYESFKRRHPQYSHQETDTDPGLSTVYWSCILESCLAYYDVMAGPPKHVQAAIDGFMGSIAAGSIYFGGTDPGRGLPTAFSKAHENGEPFFTLTQNALADGSYMEYLRLMYGRRLSIPTTNEVQAAYEDYVADAERRHRAGQLKPGEDFLTVDGKPQVRGQVAVMAINARIARMIFDQNPRYAFFIEESFPLDWMYPHLEPHGLIMKVNREQRDTLPSDVVDTDTKYWRERVDQMIGPWLHEATPISEIVRFVERSRVRPERNGYEADPAFLENEWAQKAFSKWRSSIAGVYAWRASHDKTAADRQRMGAAADFAFRQAFALCPSSPEALYRYINQLIGMGGKQRFADALAIAEVSYLVTPNPQTKNLISEIKRLRDAAK